MGKPPTTNRNGRPWEWADPEFQSRLERTEPHSRRIQLALVFGQPDELVAAIRAAQLAVTDLDHRAPVLETTMADILGSVTLRGFDARLISLCAMKPPINTLGDLVQLADCRPQEFSARFDDRESRSLWRITARYLITRTQQAESTA